MSNESFIEICQESKSMAEAAAKMGIHFNTFKKRATKLGVYKPNQSGKGISKPIPVLIPTKDILDGKHPQYSTYTLKLRLFKEGLKYNECEICSISEWNGKRIECQLDHIDGNRTNHRLENLRILCPNCHSQTETFTSKKNSKKDLEV